MVLHFIVTLSASQLLDYSEATAYSNSQWSKLINEKPEHFNLSELSH